MYLLQVRTHLDAAHRLVGYRGKCERVHGHTWRVRVAVAVQTLNSIGLGVDFHELESAVNEVIARFDHAMLNDLPEFANQNPSAENLSRIIYEQVTCKLPAVCKLREVEVWESDKFSAVYREDHSQSV